ncbi:MAG: polyphosphate kinase 2 family protein [Ilumatobacteraceae bacterium]
MTKLGDLELDEHLSKKEYAQRLEMAQRRLLQLRLHLGGQMGAGELGPGLLIVFEGRDAAGKGGAIKRLAEPLDPRHYRVSSYAKPTYDEKRHHFLRRFYRELPGLGGMAVFDRSWYGRVLVERIEGFATTDQWGRAYEEIVSFERTLVLEGLVLVKFWLHISDEEQLKRFDRRANDPLRRWKITEEDWRNRKRNADYDVAAEDMFERTDHRLAPWDLVGANQKRYARVQVIETLNRRIEAGMQRWGTPVPPQSELTGLDDE